MAKATYQRVTDAWKIFWQRADGRWHGYQPAPFVRRVEEFLAIVEKDHCAAFFG